jgi:hypothetical protein
VIKVLHSDRGSEYLNQKACQANYEERMRGAAHDGSGVVQHLAEGESGGRGQFGCMCTSYRARLTCARALAVTSLHASGDDTSYHVGVACVCFSPGIDVAREEMNIQRVHCEAQAIKKR